jgi:hypothetical protein
MEARAARIILLQTSAPSISSASTGRRSIRGTSRHPPADLLGCGAGRTAAVGRAEEMRANVSGTLAPQATAAYRSLAGKKAEAMDEVVRWRQTAASDRRVEK